jgi:WD40 repeat protein
LHIPYSIKTVAARTTRIAAANLIGGARSGTPTLPALCKDTGTLCVVCIAVAVYALSRSGGEKRRAVASETDVLENDSDYVRTVAWSFDGKLLASGGDDEGIILWDAKKGERLTELKGHG